jgi:signal transduction histidine kinase
MPVQLSRAPIVQDGEVTGAVVVFDDVSEQQAIDRLKSEFVSVVSHELRTPLTSLQGSLDLMAHGVLGELSPSVQRMADIALTSTGRLVRLVDDILDLERLVGGQVVLERRQHALADLARTSLAALQGLAGAKGVELRLDVDDSQLWCDGDRVVQVLVNLLGNAVKFSPAGAVVDLRGGNHEGQVVLEVEDRGRGIPADQLERVFERFAQVDASDSRDHGGSGLGLAIARNVVGAHDGVISAQSELGKGTTFSVVLPQRRARNGRHDLGRRAQDPLRVAADGVR